MLKLLPAWEDIIYEILQRQTDIQSIIRKYEKSNHTLMHT
jgi:hypothetical protein